VDEHKLVDEIVALRALVSRLKQCLQYVRPYLTSPTSQKRVNRAVADNKDLDYEIH
jgi:hypothetical protein